MDLLWVVKNLKLHFRLGVRNIFSVNVATLLLDSELTYKPDIPDKISLPEDKFTAEIDAVYISSIPLQHQGIEIDGAADMSKYSPAQYVRYYIEILGGHSDYLKRLPTGSRQNIKRRVRKFSEHCGGGIKWKEFTGIEMNEFYHPAREVSKTTYQDQLLGEGLPDSDDFYNKMMELASMGKVKGFLLFHENRPIAYSYCSVDNDILLRERCGYDPEYRQWGPGSILYYLVIEKLFHDHKFRILDMGPGDFDYKKALATGNIACADIMFFKNTIKNKALINLHSGWVSAIKHGINGADMLKIKPILKKLNRQM